MDKWDSKFNSTAQDLGFNREVSVVILTKNSARTIKKCLESVVREEPKEIIAVDALSNDETIDILYHYGVKIVTDSIGPIGHSRQIGVDAATGGYVMFVDSDVELGLNCINTMLNELVRNDWVGIHAVIRSAENVSYWQRAQDKDYLRYFQPGPIKRIDASAALFRKDILLKFSFDRDFESAEDVELSRRLVGANYKLGVSTAIAYHTHRREFTAFAKQRYRNGLGLARFGVKYGVRNTRTLLGPFMTAFSLTIRSPCRKDMKLIPYRLVQAPIIFAGILAGLSKVGFCVTERSPHDIN